MNTIKTVFYVLLVIALALYIGGFKISFKPFHVELGTWYNIIGYFFIVLAFAFLDIGATREGYKKGYEKGTDDTLELVQKLIDKKIEEQLKTDSTLVSKDEVEIPDLL